MSEFATPAIAFLFTDIKGSTRLWEEQPEGMREALARHDAVIGQAIEQHRGSVFKTVGDAFCAVFAEATDAVAAALQAQRALHAQQWGDVGEISVRMALHAGLAEERRGDYFGPTVNRVARILSSGHGGQILLSQDVADRVQDALPAGAGLGDLGEHRLRDLVRSERLFQLLHPDLPGDFPPLRSLAAFAHNLPVHMSRFVGRQQQMAETRRLLQSTRLLTLTGTGGCGKTRLALQVGADLLEEYEDGVWLVELAPLPDRRLVAQAVASALGVQEEPQHPLTATLAAELSGRCLLLLLDNCEHVIEGAAQLAEDLLRGCPRVRILATSREALHAEGEVVWRVPSLSTPDPEQLESVGPLTRYEAVELFLDRALAARPGFVLTHENASVVARICGRLDGIPLALELAATQLRAMPPEQIERRLNDRFRLLKGGRRTALPRQQTLQAAFDWSHDLLSEAERTLLRRLSVFAGGWALAAAEAVCAGEGVEEAVVLETLLQLVDKSLVMAEERTSEARYRLLETVRQYAATKLGASGEDTRLRDRHSSYYLGWAEEAEAELVGPRQGVWLARLEAERDNVRAALTWCQGQEGSEGLRLAAAMLRFWLLRSCFTEGRAHLAAMLGAPGAMGRTTERARALNGAGGLALCQGDYQTARGYLEESLAIRRELGDRTGVASALNNLGVAARDQGDYGAAQALFEESLAIHRELEDHEGIGATLANLGNVAWDQGDCDVAQPLYEESLAIRRQLGDRQGVANCLNNLGNVADERGDHQRAWLLHQQSLIIRREIGDERGIAHSLGNLGDVAYQQGEYDEAFRLVQEGLTILRDLGDQGGVAEALEILAAVAAGRQCSERAARLWGAAEMLRETLGPHMSFHAREQRDRLLASVRAALPRAIFERAWSGGRAMAVEEAIAYALEP